MFPVILILLAIATIVIAVIFLTDKRKKKVKAERLAKAEKIAPEVESALFDIGSYYNYGHYITESERKALNDKYVDLALLVRHLARQKYILESPAKDVILRFDKAMSDTVGFKRINNERFIENELARCKEYFDTVLPHPLDNQQREAVVSLEDNVLVISSAGSGKTMTTVGKVRYLIDVQHVDPEKILLITFTRKAAESLSERLGEKKLKCRTFHKLALDLIGEATGEKPSITNKDFSVQVYHKLFNENEDFHSAIADYVVSARYKMKDQFEYDSAKDYMTDRQKYGVHAYFKDMDGKPVFCKSDEESQICDFLGSRGVRFRYEEKYEFSTIDADHRQYCPDFSIYYLDASGTERRVYLEHFAVNEAGRCPGWFTSEDEQKYIDGMQWKRNLHAEKGTMLLETSSADFHKGDVFRKLAYELQNLGIQFKFAGNGSLSRDLVKQEENILNTLTAFNFLMKSKDTTIQAIQAEASLSRDRFMVNDIVAPFVRAYAELEEELDEIDFTDAIIRATELCNNGHRPDYDYILVDEFQDISMDRYRFLQSLRKPYPLTKLFCVGDDWQSIYRFAGSDMALFKSFEKFFGYTKKCFMETTYRFGEPAIAESSKFILANPEQEAKQVHPFRPDAETSLDFLGTDGREGLVETIKWIADQIPTDKEIMLLGRYSYDVNILKKTDLSVCQGQDGAYVMYGKRRMNFLTVHKSKGLECDYVILLNCNGGSMGFPADIADSPVLKYVLSEPDAYAFSEERRVFYVGITRAKIHTWVLYDIYNPSPFVNEFVAVEQQNAEPSEQIPSEDLCPKCHCGRKVMLRKGVAVNGNPYSVIGCSNNIYGCDYHETVFVNINGYRKPRHNNGFTTTYSSKK